ncbi:hypothetical protein PybrP1_010029 [[Pythium] brassicae (nom. inval.)]|nr:hypothetical protein PybrP1_010029 [[Pythium] brassicae (nom. inval.)]
MATLPLLRRSATRASSASASLLRARRGVPSAAVQWLQQPTRFLQSSATCAKQHTSDVTPAAKRSVAAALADERQKISAADNEGGDESDDDDEGGDGSDDDDELLEDDDEEEEEEDEEDEDEPAEIDPENPAAAFLGVTYYPTRVKKYSAELHIDGHVISGGDYWTALDAAKGYDELVDLYCDLDTPRNFPAGAEAAEDAAASNADPTALATAAGEVGEWAVPEVGKRHADIIPPIPQTYLTLDEVLAALENEKAIDVYTVDLAGKSSLADYMIFTTGRSQAHMRRMADMMIGSMRARKLVDEFEYAVEGRDCDDWMIADCNNIVVHFMNADTRRILALEEHWENFVDNKHRLYGDMTEDEYMDKFGTSELMEYLDDDDRVRPDDDDDSDGSGVEWK